MSRGYFDRFGSIQRQSRILFFQLLAPCLQSSDYIVLTPRFFRLNLNSLRLIEDGYFGRVELLLNSFDLFLYNNELLLNNITRRGNTEGIFRNIGYLRSRRNR